LELQQIIMYGFESRNDAFILYVSPESFVPEDHPFSLIRLMADKSLASLSGKFEEMYSHTGVRQFCRKRF
jgi:hypothetical protein